MIQIILFCIACSVFLIWLWPSPSRSTKGLILPPVLPGKLPIVGHALMLLGSSQELFKVVKKVSQETAKQGGVSTLLLGQWRTYVITDPDDSNTVAKTCLQKDRLYDIGRPWFGDGLVTASLSIWKRHRKLLNPTLNRHVVEGFQSIFNTLSEQLVNSLEVEVGKGMFDHCQYLERTTLEIICLTSMGTDKDDPVNSNHKYIEACQILMNIFIQRFQKIWMHSDYLFYWTKLKKMQDKLCKIVHGMSDAVIKRRKVALKGKVENDLSGTKLKPFMDLLLELSTEGTLTDREVREEVDSMIVGGFDTTATALTFILSVLGSYPEIQERIYKELKDVFNDTEREIEKQDLSKLVYTEAAIMETLRLFPIIPAIARYIDRDLPLRNFTLQANSSCFISIYKVNRNPILWGSDAEVFKPERWLDPSTMPSNPNAYGAFSFGRRNCIGKTFAVLSVKTVLAYILRRYRITSDISNMEIKLDILIRPVSGHHISIERR